MLYRLRTKAVVFKTIEAESAADALVQMGVLPIRIRWLQVCINGLWEYVT
jgi:hypothetical protein